MACRLSSAVCAFAMLTTSAGLGKPALASGWDGVASRQVGGARDTGPKPGTGILRGRVIADDSRRPLRRAQVHVMCPDLRISLTVMTEADGTYEVANLPACQYAITAALDGFVSAAFGETGPSESAARVVLREKQIVERLDIRLSRGGVIFGRVVDDVGEPVAAVQVRAMRSQFTGGRRHFVWAGVESRTNDMGEFRIFALAPGPYLVSAVPRVDNQAVIKGNNRGFVPTYYPGTTDLTNAATLTVKAGETVGALTMPLTLMRLASIRGVMPSFSRRQDRPAALNVRRTDGLGAKSVPVGPDGTFWVVGLAPGEYTLETNVVGSDASGIETYVTSVQIDGDDVNGVVLTPMVMASVTGRVTVDPAEAASLRSQALQVGVSPAVWDHVLGMQRPGLVRDDLTFEFKSWPGLMFVRMTSSRQEWMVKAVRLGGIDVTDSGIQFLSGKNVDGLEIQVTNVRQELSGGVTDVRGENAKQYTVVVFSQDQNRWSYDRYLALGHPGQDGRFTVGSLPPGSYYAVALDHVELDEWRDPALLTTLARKAVRFSLAAGEKRSMELRMNSGQ